MKDSKQIIPLILAETTFVALLNELYPKPYKIFDVKPVMKLLPDASSIYKKEVSNKGR